MAIRKREAIKFAVLKHVEDGNDEYRQKTIIDAVANYLSLTDEERNRKVASGNRVFYNNCMTVINQLKKAKLLERTKPGHYRITPNGLKFLKQNPAPPAELNPIDDRISPPSRDPGAIDDVNCPTPEECIEKCYQQHREELAAELLEQIMDNSPTFFEELVIDLLVEMGYGGSREDAEAVGRSGDGGIDGIIKEDRLGLDVIYVQAKRWDGNVGRREIHRFSGALRDESGARKGIFITTSGFTKEARNSADNSDDPKIVLIDGEQLVQLMIDHDVGVSTVKTYEIKRVDSDYFIETDDPQTEAS